MEFYFEFIRNCEIIISQIIFNGVRREFTVVGGWFNSTCNPNLNPDPNTNPNPFPSFP